MKKIVIFGATSAIAQAVCREFAAAGADLFLVARSAKRLEALGADLITRFGISPRSRVLDFNNDADRVRVWKEAVSELGSIDCVLIAHGALPDQTICRQSWASAEASFQVNLLSAAALAEIAAGYFEVRKEGCLAAITSVAADRGRQSNYLYGAAKAGLATYLQGLRNRLHPAGVAVVEFKLGFVDTPMTSHLPKGFLFAKPDQIAKGIVRAMRRRANVVYLPSFWRWIMLPIRLLPEPLFKRLKL